MALIIIFSDMWYVCVCIRHFSPAIVMMNSPYSLMNTHARTTHTHTHTRTYRYIALMALLLLAGMYYYVEYKGVEKDWGGAIACCIVV
jgi:hypothetical protein